MKNVIQGPRKVELKLKIKLTDDCIKFFKAWIDAVKEEESKEVNTLLGKSVE
jgi:hypothetical protein